MSDFRRDILTCRCGFVDSNGLGSGAGLGQGLSLYGQLFLRRLVILPHCAVIWVRFPFDVISKQPALEHKIRGCARGQSQHHDLLAATGDRNGFWVGLD